MFWVPTSDVPGSEYAPLWQFANQDERKFKMHFWNSLSPLGAQNKDISTASQTLLRLNDISVTRPISEPAVL